MGRRWGAEVWCGVELRNEWLGGTPGDRLKGEAGEIGAAGVAMKSSGGTQVELKECSLKGNRQQVLTP